MKISINTFLMGNVVKLVKMFWLLEPRNFQIAYRHRSPEADELGSVIWEPSTNTDTQVLSRFPA